MAAKRAKRSIRKRIGKGLLLLGAGRLHLRRIHLSDAAGRPSARESKSHHDRFHAVADRRSARRGPEVFNPQSVGAVREDLSVPEASGDRHRRRGVLRSRRRRSGGDQGVARKELGRRSVPPRRQHDLATARQESVLVAVEKPDAQGQGAADHPAPRSGAHQAAHLRDLSEHDRVGRRHLRLRGRRARLLRKALREPGHPGGGVDGGRDHQSARAQSGETDAAVVATAADHLEKDAVQAARAASAGDTSANQRHTA